MLPGLGFSEIVILAVIALLVIGPKDLPNFLRTLGRFTRKMQAMAAEFRQGFDELARQAELDELRKEVDALRNANPLSALRDEARAIERETMSPIEPPIEPPPASENAAAGEDAAAAEPVTQAAEPAPEGRRVKDHAPASERP